MLATGNYYNPVFQGIEIFIYNASYGCALYCLLLFLLATKNHIKKFHPVCKTITVKLIIFTSFYQSLGVQLIHGGTVVQFAWKNLLLCIEMTFFSIAMWCAFPISEFMAGIPDRRFLANIKDLLTVRDIYEGFEHNFKPVYRDYALQRSQNEAPETVRLRTYFVGNVDHVAIEMTERYRGRSKRLAFNSLLRGSKPVAAGLRKYREQSFFSTSQSPTEDSNEESIEIIQTSSRLSYENLHEEMCGMEESGSGVKIDDQDDDVINPLQLSKIAPPNEQKQNQRKPITYDKSIFQRKTAPLSSTPNQNTESSARVIAPVPPELVGELYEKDEPSEDEWGEFN